MSSSLGGASSGGASSGVASSGVVSSGVASSGVVSSGGASSGGASSGGASQKQGGASQTSGGASQTSGGASQKQGGASQKQGGASPEAIADKIKKLKVPDPESGASKLTGQQVSDVWSFWFALLIQLVLEPSDVTVLDAFGNVGGDAILMALIGMKVLTHELKKERFEYLTRNVASLGLGDRITPMWGNFLDWLKGVKPGTKFDVVYLDPPWFPGNGPHNPKKQYRDLFIIDGAEFVSVFDVITRLFKMGLTDTVVLKIPPNSKFEQLSEAMKKASTPVKGGSKYAQYRLVVIDKTKYVAHLESL
jgi:hypothetical protein